ncbi:MAG: acyltransferase [Clostridia bacterium]|nr:acyltransferase [Clostridia bacterium]
MGFSKQDTKCIKALAVMLMLYHHLFAFSDRVPEGGFRSFFAVNGSEAAVYVGVFGKLCVALFLFLGGYGTYLSYSKKQNGGEAMLGRVGRLYLDYWKVFFVFIPICLLLEVPLVSPDGRVFFENLLGIRITYNGEWWFFTPYVALLLLYPLLHRLLQRRPGLCVELLLVCLLAASLREILPWVMGRDWAASFVKTYFWRFVRRVPELLPAFLMGCIFAKHDLLSRIKAACADRYWTCVPALGAVACLFYLWMQLGDAYGCDYDYLLAPIFTAAMAILLNMKGISFFKKGLAFIGEKSTGIWLIHSFWCYSLTPRMIYAPRFSFFIFLWLLAISLTCAVLLDLAWHYAGWGMGLLLRKMEKR